MKEILDFAITTVKAAGDITLQYFGNNPDVELKPDQTPVTQADKACEAAIISCIQKHFPDDTILGEESGEIAGKSEFKWILDPIDGTKSFIHGIPIYATLLGVEKAGECVVGVAYAPAMNELTYASKGGGCYINGEPVAVSEIGNLDKSMLFYTSFRGFYNCDMHELFLQLMHRTELQRGLPDYYGHILIAKGCGEVMVEPLVSPWDIAALKVIIEEAGGRLTDFDGRPTIYSGCAVTSNGKVHDEVLDIIRKCGVRRTGS